MSFRFEKLEIWKDARNFIILIYRITSKYPKSELFGLTNQIRRAVVSIALNIAEGSIRRSDKEFIRFLRISMGSTAEVTTALYVSLDQNFINKKEFDQLYTEANLLAARINTLINKLKQ